MRNGVASRVALVVGVTAASWSWSAAGLVEETLRGVKSRVEEAKALRASPERVVEERVAGADLPPGFDAKAWEGLIQRAIRHGERTPGPYSPREVWAILSRRDPDDPQKPRAADYFSVVAFKTDSLGGLRPLYVSAVSEVWTINAAGNWEVDQWIYRVSLDGTLSRVEHRLLEETRQRVVVRLDTLETGWPESPGPVLERWGSKLAEWIRSPESSRRVVPL